MLRFLVGFTVAICLHAQEPPDPQLVAAFRGVASHAERLTPLLEQVRAREWVLQGAPETYVLQLEAARRQIQAIAREMNALAQHPEGLQDCMKALFRVQTFHGSLESLLGGLRRYQNPALADLIGSVASEDEPDLERLQTYILQLADEKDQEFQVVEHEAQRCRTQLSKDAPKGKKP